MNAIATLEAPVAEKPKYTKEFIKSKLATDARWAIRGMIRIYEFQTAHEQASEHTEENNAVGFNGTDAEILTSFVKFYQKFNRLSDNQMKWVFKKMPKYAGQLCRIIEGKQ